MSILDDMLKRVNECVGPGDAEGLSARAVNKLASELYDKVGGQPNFGDVFMQAWEKLLLDAELKK
jgi:hypothetical protein